MFTKFKFSNFLSFKDEATLSMYSSSLDDGHEDVLFRIKKDSLLKTIAIYGPNASGKTTIYKAISVFRTMVLNSFAFSLVGNKINVKPFILSSDHEDMPTNMEAEFVIDGIKYIYGFSIKQDIIISEFLLKGKKMLFSRKDKSFSFGKKFDEMYGIFINSTRPNVLFLTMLASNNQEIPSKIVEVINKVEVVFVQDVQNMQDFSFNSLKTNNEISDYQKAFMKEADFGINDMNCIEENITINDANKKGLFPPGLLGGDGNVSLRGVNFLHTQYRNNIPVREVPLSIGEESEGTRHAFNLSGPIADILKNGKTLFIDELDTSLHPLLCRAILKKFNSKENKNNARLIFTTHDISLLDKEFFRRDQIRFTEKDNYGASRLFSLADIENRKEVSFSKRYLEGRYGAIPYLKSLEGIEQYE